MQLSDTSQKLLAIFFENPKEKFYTNELIRKSGLYPNSVQKSLESLVKQEIIVSVKARRFKFYGLNTKCRFIDELERIVSKKYRVGQAPGENEFHWVKILNRPTSYSFTDACCVSNISLLKKVYGISISNFWHNSITGGVYYLREDLSCLGKRISELIEKKPSFAKQDVSACRKSCDDLVSGTSTISSMDLAHMPDKDLVKVFRRFYQSYLRVFPYVTAPHGIESYFERKIRESVKDEEVLKKLVSPIFTRDEERDEALVVAAYAKANGFDDGFYKLLSHHWEKFCWLPLWSIYAEPLSRDYFEEEIKNMLEKVANPREEVKRLKNDEDLAVKELDKILKLVKASRSLRDRVSLLQEYIYLRIYRKNAICKAHYHILPLLNESANRLKLEFSDSKLLSFKEIIDGLTGKVSEKELSERAGSRKQGWALIVWKGKFRTIVSAKNIIETMEHYRIVAPGSVMQRAVKGRVACTGKATGKVKVVKKLSELSKVEEGDILVTKMTTPDYVMAMHKAAAIVTDEGGVTCHAAIVSREFNIPCIVGTKNATQILADNDIVEVDATEGVVRVVEAVAVPEDIRTIVGKTIYKGKVKGTARIVLDAADFSKIKVGDIIITPQTTPEYLSSLYRVKGFIVDEEALTSHAVLYGKALKLPSIMGTNFARNVIHDGEMIELDATRGFVRRLTLGKN
ncbi:MAG: PEP-utilizing enzyme [Bacteroidota bacterium]